MTMSDQPDKPVVPPSPVAPVHKISLRDLGIPLSILLGFAMLVAGQHYLPSVDPTPGPPLPVPVVVEPTTFVPADSIATKDGIRLDAERTKLICDIANAGDGTFVLRYQPVGKAEITRTIVVSGDKPPIPPVPPGPTPPPVPPTPVPPIPTGPLTILLIRESKDSTPEMATTIRDLRTGAAADYLKSKSHSLGILDVDAKDPDGKPSPAVEEWRKYFAGLTLPAVVMYDPATKQLIHKQPLAPGTTAASLITTIKEHGG